MNIPEKLYARGHELDLSDSAFGELRKSDDIAEDFDRLRLRFEEDGYLYIPGYLDRSDILEARAFLTDALAAKGVLDPTYPAFEGVKKEDADLRFLSDPRLAVEYMIAVAKNNSAMRRILYSGRIIEFFRAFFKEAIRHFDFTWVRTMGKGLGTEPHCDVVYMGRGTPRVCTCWIPYGDLSLDVGGLMTLEDSHLKQDRLKNYLSRDVDNYCTNRPEADEIESGKIPWKWGGVLSKNPATLREHLGGRWLVTNYRAGDVLIFGLKMVHASLDNQTSYFRFSSDTRYQPASEPIDERWIGETPIGHGQGAKRGLIC